jgi:hypothetical protein
MDDDWQNLAPNSLGELAPVTAATLWKTHDDTKQGGMGKNISKTKRASPVGEELLKRLNLTPPPCRANLKLRFVDGDNPRPKTHQVVVVINLCEFNTITPKLL